MGWRASWIPRARRRQTVPHLLLALVCVALPWLGTASPHATAQHAPGGPAPARIVFANGDGIFTVDPDGADLQQLASGPNFAAPAWSPDGRQIAYNLLANGQYDVHVMNADGSGATAIATSPMSEAFPRFSPDGLRIAYTFGVSAEFHEVWVMQRDGTGAARISGSGGDGRLGDGQADWLGGNELVFWTDRDASEERDAGVHRSEIYRMAADGSGQRRLTNDPSLKHFPSASPDGSEVAYADVTHGGIWIVAATGGTAHRVTTLTALGRPTWSPDGARLAFWAPDGLHAVNRDGTGIELIYAPAQGSVGSADWQPVSDRDGDALLDEWEESGIDVDGDGVIDLDLPAMGADPDHKDIFIEVDWMAGHAFADAELMAVVEAFGRAPVANPDGVMGIALHIDNGPQSEMDPATHDTWGLLSRATELAHADELGTTVGSQYQWAAFDALKASHFEPVREKVFHYAISVHQLGGKPAAGISRGVAGGASDFIISHGTYVDGVDADSHDGEFRTNTFMHELGHNLGLPHGGTDGVNRKPNYLSVMNYAFAGYLPLADGTSVLDYSRYVVPFDEADLDEQQGFGLPPGTGPASFISAFRCPDTSTMTVPLRATAVDWDCDGVVSASAVAADTNSDGAIEPLGSQVDWDKLVFDGGLIGAKEDVHLPESTELDEPTVEEISADADRLRCATTAAEAGACPSSGGAAGPDGTADGGGSPWPPLIAATAGTLVAGGFAVFVMRRRRTAD